MMHHDRTVLAVARVNFHDGKGTLKRVLECRDAVLRKSLLSASTVRANEMQRLTFIFEELLQILWGSRFDPWAIQGPKCRLDRPHICRQKRVDNGILGGIIGY